MDTSTNRYSTSTIYKISCLDSSKSHIIYIGGTTNFINRQSSHYYALNDRRKKDRTLYKFMKENGGFNNFCFTILGEYCLNSKAELIKKEEEFIRLYSPKLNMNHAARNRTEYRNENKEMVRKINSKCYRKYREQNKVKRKANYQINKEKQIAVAKLYYIKNKKKLDILRKMKINCLCGCSTARTGCKNHRETEKHKLHIAEVFNNNKLFIKQKNLHNN